MVRIDLYKMVHEMFSIFTAEDSRENDHAEGFVTFWGHVVDPSHVNDDWLRGILASSSQTVQFKPLSGILNQRRYLSSRIMPLTIESSLVVDPFRSNCIKYGKTRLCGW